MTESFIEVNGTSENVNPDTTQKKLETSLVFVIEAWLVFLDWRKRDDEAIAMALFMVDE